MIIKVYKEYREIIKKDKKRNTNEEKKLKFRIWQFVVREHGLMIRSYMKLLRKEEFFSNISWPLKGLKYLYRNRKNRLGERLGFTIYANVFKGGLKIWHYGNIVVNGYSQIGENCTLHGDNCIGNNGFNSKAPIIGNNVDIGVGAKVIGDIYIADGIIIGANSVVNKSFYEKNITIAGVQAKKIKNNNIKIKKKEGEMEWKI